MCIYYVQWSLHGTQTESPKLTEIKDKHEAEQKSSRRSSWSGLRPILGRFGSPLRVMIGSFRMENVLFHIKPHFWRNKVSRGDLGWAQPNLGDREGSNRSPKASQEKTKKRQRTCQDHTKTIQEHTKNMPRKCEERSKNIPRTCQEHAKNIPRTCQEHTENPSITCQEHTKNLRREGCWYYPGRSRVSQNQTTSIRQQWC